MATIGVVNEQKEEAKVEQPVQQSVEKPEAAKSERKEKKLPKGHYIGPMRF